MEGKENFRDAKPAAIRSDVNRIIRYTISVVACILIVLLGVVGYNFYRLSATKIFTEQYSPYELAAPADSGTSHDVETLYREKKFDEVHEIARLSNDRFTLFLAGMSSMEIKNYARAIRYFKRVIDINEKAGTRHLADEAEYYLALAYIVEKDFDLALELLQKIHDNKDHLYNQKVGRKLIRQVKWLKWR